MYPKINQRSINSISDIQKQISESKSIINIYERIKKFEKIGIANLNANERKEFHESIRKLNSISHRFI